MNRRDVDAVRYLAEQWDADRDAEYGTYDRTADETERDVRDLIARAYRATAPDMRHRRPARRLYRSRVPMHVRWDRLLRSRGLGHLVRRGAQ